ncbi:MAG: universal stress protein [Sphingomonadales bacterium]|nr:universal stress protein [Sphingomonadales bacterium]
MILERQPAIPKQAANGERLWKFLVVVDETPEFHTALRFASRRAAKIGGMVTLLFVIPPADFQHWGAVEDLMRQEAQQEARAVLDKIVGEVRALSGLMPEVVIREGKPEEQIVAQIADDPDIHILVLGAANADNPGPLVSAFSGPLLRALHIPVVFVPGNLTDEAIDRLV